MKILRKCRRRTRYKKTIRMKKKKKRQKKSKIETRKVGCLEEHEIVRKEEGDNLIEKEKQAKE